MYISRCAFNCMNQSTIAISSYMCFHSKIVIVSFSSAVHFWITLFRFILCARRSCNYSSIYSRSFFEQKSLVFQYFVNTLKHYFLQLMLFKEMSKTQYSTFIRNAISCDINIKKLLKG